MLLAIFLSGSACKKASEPPREQHAAGANDETELSRARHRFSTRLVRQGRSPAEVDDFDVPNDARLVLYSSGDLKLKAWVSPDTKDGARHPALVYLHGN